MENKKKYSQISQNHLAFHKCIDMDVDYQESIPEYCDDIFRVIKCSSKSHISSVETTYNEVKLHGKVQVHLTYLNDENTLCYTDFEESFTKSIDIEGLSDAAFANTFINDKYTSFRVINQRRIDIHSSSKINIYIYDKKECSYLCSCDNSKLKREKLKSSFIHSSSIIKSEFDEEISISSSVPIKKVISSSQYITVTETKVIKDKILVKCAVTLSLLYTTDESNEKLDKFEYSFSLSKIIDISGIDEKDIVICNAEISNIFFKARNPLNDKISVVEAYGEAAISTIIIKEIEQDVITDGYAICKKSKCDYTDYNYYKKGALLTDTKQLTLDFDMNSNIKEIKELSIKLSNQSIKNKKLCFTAFIDTICLSENDLISQASSSNVEIEAGDYEELISSINIVSYDYTLQSSNKIQLRLSIDIKAYLFSQSCIKALSEIDISDKDIENSALTIYFAKKNESLWNIAKSFSSDESIIMTENDLTSNILDENRVLIIPSV